MRVMLTAPGFSVLTLGSLIVYSGFYFNNSYVLALGLGVLTLLLSGIIFYKKITLELKQTEKATLLEYGIEQSVEFTYKSSAAKLVVVVRKTPEWNAKQKYYINNEHDSMNIVFTPLQSGKLDKLTVVVESTDPLNLIRYRKKISIDVNIYAKIPKIEYVKNSFSWLIIDYDSSYELEDYTLRQWQNGEGLDLVHWKMSAKTGKKIVRIPEKNNGPVVVYCTLRENNEKQLGILRNEVEKILKENSHVTVKLLDKTCKIGKNNFQEFEFFLSKNLTKPRRESAR